MTYKKIPITLKMMAAPTVASLSIPTSQLTNQNA